MRTPALPRLAAALWLASFCGCQGKAPAESGAPFYTAGRDAAGHGHRPMITHWTRVAWDGEIFVVDGRGDLFASDDGGDHWVALTAAAPGHLAITFIVPGSSTHRLVCVEALAPDGARPYCTADRGASWDLVRPPVRPDAPPSCDHVGFAVGPSTPSYLIAAIRSPLSCHEASRPRLSMRMARSDDFGKTWNFGDGIDALKGYMSTFSGGVVLRTQAPDFGEDLSVCDAGMNCTTFERDGDASMAAAAFNVHRPEVGIFLRRDARPDQTADVVVTADSGRHYARVPDPRPCLERCLFADGTPPWGTIVQTGGCGTHLELAQDLMSGFVVQGLLPEPQCDLAVPSLSRLYCRGRAELFSSTDAGVSWRALELPGAPRT